MQEITSASNPRIKLARKLSRRRAREQAGLCLLEGSRLVMDAWSAGVRFDAVFITQYLLDQPEPSPLFSALEGAGVPLLLVSEALLAEISDTTTPQGIVALSHLPERPVPPDPWLVLVLDGVGDPGNAGTLLRSAVAAGVELVIFGPGTVDPFGPKVLRAGMGAQFRVAIVVAVTWDEVESALSGDRICYVADAQAPLRYDQVDWNQPAALVIGSEAQGPSQAALATATSIAIPIVSGVESLNAGMAGSVILFEAARQRRTGQSA